MSRTLPIKDVGCVFKLGHLTFPKVDFSQFGSPFLFQGVVQLDQWIPEKLRDSCYSVISLITGSLSRDTVSDQHMKEMHQVCEILGLDFEKWIRPHFKTLNTYERCTFFLNEYHRTGRITFRDGKVHIVFQSDHERFDKIFEYTVTEKGFCVKMPRPCILKPEGTHLVMTFCNRESLFVNKTPENICAQPAVPSYA